MIFNLFKTIKECQHTKVSPDEEGTYCPDCGNYVVSKWFLTRCKCCNIKRISYSRFNKIKPIEKFCPNCGSQEYVLEELDKINFININFAVLKKIIVENVSVFAKSQLWVDERENSEQKLLSSALQ